MSITPNLLGGVVCEDGLFFVLCATDETDEDESILASGRRHGDKLVLRGIADPEEIVSIIALSDGWKAKGDAVALTADGEAILLTETTSETEIIPGAGFIHEDALRLGRMTTLKQCGDDLFALGYGGQVYVRSPDSLWRGMHVHGSESSLAPQACLYSVARDPNGKTLYFGGTNITEFEESPEIAAANENGDAELLAELILQSVKPDLTTIRSFDGTWHEIDLDYPGAIVEIIRSRDQEWLVFSNKGVIWKTPDFKEFDEVLVLDRGLHFWDIKAADDYVFLLVGQNLNRLENGVLVPIEPALPLLDEGYVNIAISNKLIVAVFDHGLMIHSASAWERITPVLD